MFIRVTASRLFSLTAKSKPNTLFRGEMESAARAAAAARPRPLTIRTIERHAFSAVSEDLPLAVVYIKDRGANHSTGRISLSCHNIIHPHNVTFAERQIVFQYLTSSIYTSVSDFYNSHQTKLMMHTIRVYLLHQISRDTKISVSRKAND